LLQPTISLYQITQKALGPAVWLCCRRFSSLFPRESPTIPAFLRASATARSVSQSTTKSVTSTQPLAQIHYLSTSTSSSSAALHRSSLLTRSSLHTHPLEPHHSRPLRRPFSSTMANKEDLLRGILSSNAVYAAAFAQSDPALLKKLAVGQSPRILWLGCSDSRVSAEL